MEENIWIKSWYELFIYLLLGRSWNQLQILTSNWGKYLNKIVVRIIHLSCVCRSWNQLQIFASHGREYFKWPFVWSSQLSQVHRSWNQIQIFASNWGEYFNRTFVSRGTVTAPVRSVAVTMVGAGPTKVDRRLVLVTYGAILQKNFPLLTQIGYHAP